MFSGIIKEMLPVASVELAPWGRRLTLAADWPEARVGQSVAVNGCCLTISVAENTRLGFDVVQETLARSNLGLAKAGERVHVEPALRVGDSLDGHFVQGHIDGTAALTERVAEGGEVRLRVRAPAELAKYLTPKGSVALDGVSLTIARLDGPIFEVALIPTTLKLTLLAERTVGWPYNLETDILAKTIVSYLEHQGMPGRI